MEHAGVLHFTHQKWSRDLSFFLFFSHVSAQSSLVFHTRNTYTIDEGISFMKTIVADL